MKAYAIALIVSGSVAALVLILYCICKSGRKKKSHNPVSTRNVTGAPPPPPPPIQANRDVEKGEIKEMRDGGMVIVGAAAAIVASAPVITSAYNGGGGSDDGGTTGGVGGMSGGCGGEGGNEWWRMWWLCGRKAKNQPVTRDNVLVHAPRDVEKAAVTSNSARRDWGIRGLGGGRGGGMSFWGGSGGAAGLGGGSAGI
ncbi:uncharacterized protein LOC132644340 [Lycium barbarum]|uniref:uncharacterized protein LOC132644340 n=1 Tax=Lycium barbarum TaxID=112863 RepID=UPI00293EAE84|nr:uncharacterized protein LOC132644340 [Lycium barbarum]